MSPSSTTTTASNASTSVNNTSSPSFTLSPLAHPFEPSSSFFPEPTEEEFAEMVAAEEFCMVLASLEAMEEDEEEVRRSRGGEEDASSSNNDACYGSDQE